MVLYLQTLQLLLRAVTVALMIIQEQILSYSVVDLELWIVLLSHSDQCFVISGVSLNLLEPLYKYTRILAVI